MASAKEPVPKLPPVQEELPLDPDDLYPTNGEELGSCRLQTSGVPPNVLPGDRELCSPPPLSDESKGCWIAEHKDTHSAPLVLSTNEVPPPPDVIDLQSESDGRNFGSTSHDFQDPDSQFDELMEEFVSPDEFYSTFSRFEDGDAETGNRGSPLAGGLERAVEEDEVIMLSSDGESGGSEEVEEVDYVRTVSDVATEAGISNLFDPRVLGTCVKIVWVPDSLPRGRVGSLSTKAVIMVLESTLVIGC